MELLNEYSKNIGYFNEEDLQGQTKAWILSKEFGWIKWLVENDKIDRRGIDKPIEYIEFYSDYNLDSETYYYSDVDSLIMLLAIQDEPINFLISILK